MNEKEQARVKSINEIKENDVFHVYSSFEEWPNLGSAFIPINNINNFPFGLFLIRTVGGYRESPGIKQEDLDSEKFRLYKLNPKPIHKQILGMNVEDAIKYVDALRGREVCTFIADHTKCTKECLLDVYRPQTILSMAHSNNLNSFCITTHIPDKNDHALYVIGGGQIGVAPNMPQLYLYDSSSSVLIEPKNNQGRSNCFWCQTPTKKISGISSFYDVCPKCGK